MNVLLLVPPMLAICIGVALVGTAVLTLVEKSWRPTSTRALAAAVVAPAAAGVLAVLALLVPSLLTQCHCLEHGLHHPHLCLVHPELALPLLLPSIYGLLAWLLFITPHLLALGRDLQRAARWQSHVIKHPARLVGGIPVHLADCGALGAVTVGVLAPAVVMDPRLWTALAEAERLAVVTHELGHARRRDTLTLLVLRVCCSMCPLPAMHRLLTRWRAAVELVCDGHAAAQVGDAGIVAAALLSVERFRQTRGGADGSLAPMLAVAPGAGLESRVLALLGAPASPRYISNDLRPVGVAAVLLAAVLAALPGDLAHHAVETALGLLFHFHW